MPSTITFFPVDNGDMTLIKLKNKTTILIDINIHEAAEDEQDPACNVIQELKNRLEKDQTRQISIDAGETVSA